MLTGDHSSASRRVRISRPSHCTTSIPARGEQLSGRGSIQKIHWTNPTTQKKSAGLSVLNFRGSQEEVHPAVGQRKASSEARKVSPVFKRESLAFLKNPGKMEGGHWATRVPDVLLHHTQGCPCTCTGEASSLMRRWSPSLWTWKCLNMLGK